MAGVGPIPDPGSPPGGRLSSVARGMISQAINEADQADSLALVAPECTAVSWRAS